MVSQEQFEELRLELVAYESQQADNQAEMQQEVRNQVSDVSDGLKELYTVANIAVGAVATRVTKIEDRPMGPRALGGPRGPSTWAGLLCSSCSCFRVFRPPHGALWPHARAMSSGHM